MSSAFGCGCQACDRSLWKRRGRNRSMSATQRESGIVRRLLGIGVDRDLAERLATEGQTLQKLRALPMGELVTLGLTDEQAEWIRDTSRRPIPAATVASVLTAAAWTCCIC